MIIYVVACIIPNNTLYTFIIDEGDIPIFLREP